MKSDRNFSVFDVGSREVTTADYTGVIGNQTNANSFQSIDTSAILDEGSTTEELKNATNYGVNTKALTKEVLVTCKALRRRNNNVDPAFHLTYFG